MNKVKNLIQDLGKQLFESHKRFPITMFFSLVASSFLFYFIYLETHKPEAESYTQYSIYSWKYLKIAMLAGLGISFSFALTLWSEINSDKRKVVMIWLLFFVLFLCFGYFSSWENRKVESFIIRFLVLGLAGHLLVAFLPFVNNKDNNQFWFYNKSLLIRVITTFFYSVILSGGLSLALLAIEKLFNIDLDNSVYSFIWVFFNGYINTGFFLSGIAKKETNFSEEPTYPIALKYFTQFVLLPLVVVYISILLAYSAKILVEWNLPKGWVCILILISGVFGILAFLLIHPLKSSKTWVVNFNRYFYFLMLPLVVLLFISIYVRIGNYGITESRYLVVLLGLWLFGIILYFIFSKKDDIRIIPMSLFILAMLSIVGPWSAFSVSNRSQLSRFEDFLSKNKNSSNGKIDLVKTKRLRDDKKDEIREIIEYFDNKEKVNELQLFFERDLSKFSFSQNSKGGDNLLVNVFSDILEPQYVEKEIDFSISSDLEMSISGFDYLKNFEMIDIHENEKELFSNGLNLKAKYLGNSKLLISYENTPFEFNIDNVINKYYLIEGKVNPKDMYLIMEKEGKKVGVIFNYIQGEKEAANIKIYTLNFNVLVKNSNKR